MKLDTFRPNRRVLNAKSIIFRQLVKITTSLGARSSLCDTSFFLSQIGSSNVKCQTGSRQDPVSEGTTHSHKEPSAGHFQPSWFLERQFGAHSLFGARGVTHLPVTCLR